eukprot:TRINITY_DN7507_c0_g1_i1.p1 TRINITY_DN7507_c0_g1~~TRINITY_DN7507_c0_g1_i1.p1  ORF type:complete len:531 (+),score=51.14 TRINITY_DN7507_c0_g1_i1:94-1686(+)
MEFLLQLLPVEWSQVTRRIGDRCNDELFSANANNASLLASSLVFGAGVFEGTLLTRKGAIGRGSYCFRYGVAQLLPSLVGKTKSADLLARQLKRDPSKLLLDLSAPSRSARRLSRIFAAQSLRTGIGGFIGISQILRLVEIGTRATEAYKNDVLRGREPLFNAPTERVIRLIGSDSDVTSVSMQRHGLQIVPVFEDPTRPAVRRLLKEHSQGGRIPCGWHVPDKSYGKAHSWGYRPLKDGALGPLKYSSAGFNIERNWLIPVEVPRESTASQHRVLIVEADSTIGEQSLGLRDCDNDVTLQEASQAFTMIERIAKTRGALQPGDKLVRVLLTDQLCTVRSGGGSQMTLRDSVDLHGHADIILDTKFPLIQAILTWLNNTEHITRKAGKGGKVLFNTTNAAYFASVKAFLGRHGWDVIDFYACEDRGNLPVIVYQDTTEDTVNIIASLERRGIVRAHHCCAFLDSVDGVAQLQDLSTLLGLQQDDLGFVCSALVYDALFERVRGAVRRGMRVSDIQAELDAEFEHIAKVRP